MRELLRAASIRQRAEEAPTSLSPLEDVNRWMDNPRIIDPNIDLLQRTQLWMTLRLMKGFDADEFLIGSRHAYHVVNDLMHRSQWDALKPLLQPICHEAITELAPSIERLPVDADINNIKLMSAVLTAARSLEPCSEAGIAEGTAQCDVRFTSLQAVTLHDLQQGEKPLAEPRLQESTWTFQGRVSADEQDDADASWQVVDIEWRVWEVSSPVPS